MTVAGWSEEIGVAEHDSKRVECASAAAVSKKPPVHYRVPVLIAVD